MLFRVLCFAVLALVQPVLVGLETSNILPVLQLQMFQLISTTVAQHQQNMMYAVGMAVLSLQR